MTTQLRQLEQKLRDCGPAGLLLLGNVLNAVNKNLPFDIVVDSVHDFKAGLAKSPLVSDAKCIDEVYTVYAKKPVDFADLMKRQSLISWNKRVLFKGKNLQYS